MSIKVHLEQAVKSLEAEKQTVVNAVKEKVTREKIVPYNQEIDLARDKAIAEKQASFNATIVAHQERFAKEKQEYRLTLSQPHDNLQGSYCPQAQTTTQTANSW